MPEFLAFARGPALQVSMIIFVFGVVWRLVSLLALPRPTIDSPPRDDAPSSVSSTIGEFFRRMWPRGELSGRAMFSVINGWTFHLGLAIIVFGLGAHVMLFKRLIGVSWPHLPSNLVFLISVITLVSLVAALLHRLTSPVLKVISTFDDYFSWIVTIVPLVTGLLATMHLGARYEWLLGVHILSVCALLIWFPFGKLMHGFLVFLTRGAIGRQLGRRGVKL